MQRRPLTQSSPASSARWWSSAGRPTFLGPTPRCLHQAADPKPGRVLAGPEAPGCRVVKSRACREPSAASATASDHAALTPVHPCMSDISWVDPGRHPGAASPEVARRMSRLRRRDNGPEMAVRRLLHARGMRYRVCYRIPGQRRRTIDIAFPRARVAVYIDGCFWHGCPEHRHIPKSNAEWWTAKIRMNRARDTAATVQLETLGWTVLRFWEHEPPELVVTSILTQLATQASPKATH